MRNRLCVELYEPFLLYVQESYLNKPNLERHSKEFKSDKKVSAHKSKKKSQMMGSDVEYDNGNISPLYSNWDQVRYSTQVGFVY